MGFWYLWYFVITNVAELHPISIISNDIAFITSDKTFYISISLYVA